jgi:hypothetical protein
MAFNGTAVLHQVSDREVRITGVLLTTGASGTIALTGHTGTTPDITLPAAFKPAPYDYSTATVSLIDSIQCTLRYIDGTGVVTNCVIAKTGTTNADFRITVTNPSGSSTSAMEMYVEYH